MKMQAVSSVEAPTQDSAAAVKPAQAQQDDFATDQRPVIVFDGVCGVCNASVNLVLDNDTTRLFRFAALQSSAGKRLLQRSNRAPDDISSVVLVLPDRHYTKSTAALKIASKLAMPFPVIAALATPVPAFLRDIAYDLLANNRYKVLGKRDVCRMSDRGFSERFIVE
jgi:predicted DCC family thiol-disulfide oxidoreductase YuxK